MRKHIILFAVLASTVGAAWYLYTGYTRLVFNVVFMASQQVQIVADIRYFSWGDKSEQEKAIMSTVEAAVHQAASVMTLANISDAEIVEHVAKNRLKLITSSDRPYVCLIRFVPFSTKVQTLKFGEAD
jgi:hypothetical protein